MEFCEFAQLLYPFIGSGQKKGDFVAELGRYIMADPKEVGQEELNEDSDYYPLDKLEEDTLGRFYSGNKPLSKRTAGKILSCLDKVRFVTFINAFPDNSQMLLEDDLKARGIDVPCGKLPETCADLFGDILKGIIEPKNQEKLQLKKPLSQERQAGKAYDVPEAETASVCGATDGKVCEYDILQEDKITGPMFEKMVDELRDFLKIDSDIVAIESVEGFEGEEHPEYELSEPEYYGEYKYNVLKEQFGMFDAWCPEPLDPDLKEKWGSVRITDEFSKCVKAYGIEDFLKIAPSDLLPMKNVVTRNDALANIRNAVRFVEHMISARDHMMISRENREIFTDISRFLHLLEMYLNLLRENSNNSDLLGDVFIFALPGDRALEEKANKYYYELISRFKDLQGRLECSNERRPN